MARGVISFVFDDGYEAVFQGVVPLLNAAEIPGTFALPLQFQEEGFPVTPWSEWPANGSGLHELAAHGKTHCDMTALGDGELASELREPAEQLQAKTLVYPGGAHNDSVVTEAEKYYSAARTTDWGVETLPPQDSHRLKTINWTAKNWSVWKANAYALWAWSTNRWLIETFHLVTDEDTDYEYTVSLRDFRKHLSFVRMLPIRTVTVRDVITHVITSDNSPAAHSKAKPLNGS